jgi:integrase
MPRISRELSAIEVRNLKVKGYHFVGGVPGLILQVTETGAKSWLLRTMVGRSRREFGLGPHPSISLAEAREAARVLRTKISAGVDPTEERLAAKRALAARRAKEITFADAAAKYIAANAAGWRNPKHRAQWAATLEAYAFPTIGKLSVSRIETAHVVAILEPIWTTKPETASRLRGRIEAVLDWATARGFRQGENVARWKGHLSAILPPKGKVQRVQHHPALDYRHVGAFVEALREVEGIGARALEFAILVAARSGEVRGARWGEIDFSSKVWVIPSERMKAGREHRVPLAEPVIRLLSALPRLEGSDLIFPSGQGGALSDMTLTAVIRRMDRARTSAGEPGWRDNADNVVTAHGFRSSFRDWSGETTAHAREVIEHALAHQLADKAEAAYQRGTLFDKRRRLMTDWADYCSRPSSAHGVVTPIRGRA